MPTISSLTDVDPQAIFHISLKMRRPPPEDLVAIPLGLKLVGLLHLAIRPDGSRRPLGVRLLCQTVSQDLLSLPGEKTFVAAVVDFVQSAQSQSFLSAKDMERVFAPVKPHSADPQGPQEGLDAEVLTLDDYDDGIGHSVDPCHVLPSYQWISFDLGLRGRDGVVVPCFLCWRHLR